MNIQEWIASIEIPDIGLNPLDHVLGNTNIPDGLIIECGVWTGSTINKIARRFPDRRVIGFDSFRGLPSDWDRPDVSITKSTFNVDGRLPRVESNVSLVEGWFDDTLSSWVAENSSSKIALLHVDCDLYESTKTVLKYLQPMFADSIVIVFDELVGYPNCENGELRALYEFAREYKPQIEWIGMNGQWEKQHPVGRGISPESVAIRIVWPQKPLFI